jgi:hypothetical protein
MKKFSVALCLSGSAFFFSCQKELQPLPTETENSFTNTTARKAANDIGDLVFYALAAGNRIDQFSVDKSESTISSLQVTGLMDGERLLAIDFRPATGQLYGVGSTGRLYVINLNSGVARAVSSTPFTQDLTEGIVGFDFNPTVDRIRLVTSTGRNLRLHPETGALVMEDGAIKGATGAMVTSVAYTNNFAGATATTLYDIDVANDKLYKQDPPNNGVLVEVGSLGVNLEGEGGFDIAPTTDGSAGSTALALYQQNKKSVLYSVNLMTGRASKIEKFEKNEIYYGIAIPTNPVAYAVSMNSLLIFNPMMPSAVISKTITGLQAGEMIYGIDFRPATGALYALGSNSRIYTINTANGAATFVATLSESLQGTSFGFDFNPIPDRIRIISNTGQNLRVNPDNGVTIVDGSINPAPASITAAGYTNSFAGTTATALYVIDSEKDLLYIQNPPNNGTLTAEKSLGIDIGSSNGFDIGGRTNNAYGLFTVGGQTSLYSVNLMSGAVMSMGNFRSNVSGFAVGLGF